MGIGEELGQPKITCVLHLGKVYKLKMEKVGKSEIIG
jgi:hypothetical protein